MKHVHLRKDKTCLNCGKHVQDRFCSHCGQENTEPIESFGHLLNHFFADVTHYDSQFFTTLKYLVFKPGFLTLQYNAGKRLSYLNPIRMYIFISAIFFLIAFSGKKEEANTDATNTTEVYKHHLADSLRALSKVNKNSRPDSAYIRLATSLDLRAPTPKDKTETLGVAMDGDGNIVFHIVENKYASLAEYDEVQKKLPEAKRDGFFSRYISKKAIRLNQEKGKHDLVIKQNVGHDIPKVMFILLPLFALFVTMLYSLYKRKYLYSQHAIFTLHFHSFVFLIFILLNLLSKTNVSFAVGSSITLALFLAIFFYLAFALHTAYREKFWLSTLKAITISILYTVTLVICNCIIFAIGFMMI